jgi:hypothetical protein
MSMLIRISRSWRRDLRTREVSAGVEYKTSTAGDFIQAVGSVILEREHQVLVRQPVPRPQWREIP